MLRAKIFLMCAEKVFPSRKASTMLQYFYSDFIFRSISSFITCFGSKYCNIVEAFPAKVRQSSLRLKFARVPKIKRANTELRRQL